MSITCPPIMPGGKRAADAGANGERKLAHDVDDRSGRCGELRDGLEGERLQCVAGEDRDGFAEGHVAGGLAAAQIVVVERGQIVMDQRVGVHHLDRSAEVGRGWRELVRDAARGLHAEDGAQALAAREGGVPHGAVNGMRFNGRGGQQTFESVVSERGASLQERKHVSGHASGLIVRERSRSDSKHEEREKTEHVAEELVPCAMPAHVDDGGTGGERDGEQAVVAPKMLCDECAVAEDLPRREVAQIEDECRRLREVELEMVRCDTAHCLVNGRRDVIVDDCGGGVGHGARCEGGGVAREPVVQDRPSEERRCRRWRACTRR